MVERWTGFERGERDRGADAIGDEESRRIQVTAFGGENPHVVALIRHRVPCDRGLGKSGHTTRGEDGDVLRRGKVRTEEKPCQSGQHRDAGRQREPCGE